MNIDRERELVRISGDIEYTQIKNQEIWNTERAVEPLLGSGDIGYTQMMRTCNMIRRYRIQTENKNL